MFARSGLARSGATRSGFYNETFAVTINGVDRGLKTRKYTPEIQKTLNQNGNTASLVVWGFVPLVNQQIIIGSGAINQRIFGGTIVRARQLYYKGQTFWQLDCLDWTRQLGKMLVSKHYSSEDAGLIALDLMANFSSGFTTTHVATGLATIDSIDFTEEPLPTCLQRLAQRAGVRQYVDPDKDLHFGDTNVTQNPTPLTAGNYGYWNLVIDSDGSQRFTRAVVEGAGGATTAPVAIGATSIPVDECFYYSASGGYLKSGSNRRITYTGVSAASGPGNITGVPASGAGSVVYALPQGQEVDVLVLVDDTAAQAEIVALEGGDGVYERFFQDRRLSIMGATSYGQSQLDSYAEEIDSGTYSTRDYFADVGKPLTVNPPNRSQNFTATITAVRIYRLAHDKWGRDASFSNGPYIDITDAIRTIAGNAVGTAGGG